VSAKHLHLLPEQVAEQLVSCKEGTGKILCASSHFSLSAMCPKTTKAAFGAALGIGQGPLFSCEKII